MFKVLHLDKNHPIIANEFKKLGFSNHFDFESNYEELLQKIMDYDGLVIRSRVKMDAPMLKAAKSLKFIARVGAGLENIDLNCADELNIKCYNAPEGNRDAVAEHAMGMLLMLLNQLKRCDYEVRNGQWNREANRGYELKGKTVGIIGYGNMGKAFAQRLIGFGVETLCYDLLPNLGDSNAQQVNWEDFTQQVDIVSLHVPQTRLTTGMVNKAWISSFAKEIIVINTARGKCIPINDLIWGLNNKKIIAAALDVLEIEKSSFENIFKDEGSEQIKQLFKFDNVLFSPHVAGWTHESKRKLGEVLVEKVKRDWV